MAQPYDLALSLSPNCVDCHCLTQNVHFHCHHHCSHILHLNFFDTKSTVAATGMVDLWTAVVTDTMSDSMRSALTRHSSEILENCRNYRPDDAYGELPIRCCGCESPDTVGSSYAEALLDTVWAVDGSVTRAHETLFWSLGILRLTFCLVLKRISHTKLVTEKILRILCF